MVEPIRIGVIVEGADRALREVSQLTEAVKRLDSGNNTLRRTLDETSRAMVRQAQAAARLNTELTRLSGRGTAASPASPISVAGSAASTVPLGLYSAVVGGALIGRSAIARGAPKVGRLPPEMQVEFNPNAPKNKAALAAAYSTLDEMYFKKHGRYPGAAGGASSAGSSRAEDLADAAAAASAAAKAESQRMRAEALDEAAKASKQTSGAFRANPTRGGFMSFGSRYSSTGLGSRLGGLLSGAGKIIGDGAKTIAGQAGSLLGAAGASTSLLAFAGATALAVKSMLGFSQRAVEAAALMSDAKNNLTNILRDTRLRSNDAAAATLTSKLPTLSALQFLGAGGSSIGTASYGYSGLSGSKDNVGLAVQLGQSGVLGAPELIRGALTRFSGRNQATALRIGAVANQLFGMSGEEAIANLTDAQLSKIADRGQDAVVGGVSQVAKRAFGLRQLTEAQMNIIRNTVNTPYGGDFVGGRNNGSVITGGVFGAASVESAALANALRPGAAQEAFQRQALEITSPLQVAMAESNRVQQQQLDKMTEMVNAQYTAVAAIKEFTSLFGGEGSERQKLTRARAAISRGVSAAAREQGVLP